MKGISRYAWILVVSAALALSWWSLDALALRYAVPAPLAAIVSATFDGAALVAAELALRHARVADSAAAVRLLMLSAVGLSGWLNWEHAVLLAYGTPGRVLFAAPPVVAGALFELELRFTHRDRLRQLGRIATPLPPLGGWAWALHPLMAFRRIDEITASRIKSIPVNVMDWRVEVEQVPAGVPDALPEHLPPALTAGTSGRSAQRRRSSGRRRPAPAAPKYATEQELQDAARAVNRTALEQRGQPAGVGRLRAELGVGQERATLLRDWLAIDALGEPGTPVESANGTEV